MHQSHDYRYTSHRTRYSPGSNGLATDKQCVYAISGYNGDTFSLLRSVEYLDRSTGPTMARVVHLGIQRSGAMVQLSWRMATNRDIAGFDVYATSTHGSAQRLNRHTFPVHSSHVYHVRLGYSGSATFSLHVLLTNGKQTKVPER